MDLGTLFATAVTVLIHFFGIGLFLVWFAIGKPMSKEEFQRWWKEVQFLPAELRQRQGGQRCW